jgi:DNA ligase-1
MEFKLFANTCDRIAAVSGKNDKRDIIGELLKQTDDDDLTIAATYLTGSVFPLVDHRKIGIKTKGAMKIIAMASGATDNQVLELYKKNGDLGQTMQELLEKKVSFGQPEGLTLRQVHATFMGMATEDGSGPALEKMKKIADLISNASPVEAKYIIHITSEDMAIGTKMRSVAEGASRAFGVDADDVIRAANIIGDIGTAVFIAKNGNIKSVMIAPLHPFSPMLASPCDGLPDILTRMKGDIAWQWKLDGERMVAHIKDGVLGSFSRNLSNYTGKLGDTLLAAIATALAAKVEDVIVDGELVAIDKKTGRVIPFQNVGRATRSKNGNSDVTLQYMLFDIVWLNGADLTTKGYKERYEILKALVEENEFVKVVPTIFSRDQTEIGDFFAASVKAGNEGLVAKQCDTTYEFGERTFAWMKLKAMLDTMDVLVMGGIWGTGAKAGTLASYYIGVPDENGKVVCVGKAATGMSDAERGKITEMLKALVVEESGTDVWVQPKVLLEVAYEEVQDSPKYERGVALRFPRIIRIREDKNEPDTLERVLTMKQKQTRHN